MNLLGMDFLIFFYFWFFCLFSQGGEHVILCGDTDNRRADAAVPVRDRVHLQRSHSQREGADAIYRAGGKIFVLNPKKYTVQRQWV